MCILQSIKWRFEVEVGEIGHEEFGVRSGANTVEDKLCGYKRACSCASIAVVGDGVAPNGDSGAVGVGLGWMDFADHSCVSNI